MNETSSHPFSTGVETCRVVRAGADRFQAIRSLGISRVDFKTSSEEGTGLFMIENTLHARGGPPRHTHLEQDECFYILEGTFAFEVGDQAHQLSPGDSLFAPRRVPHTWAFTGEGQGRVLIVFNPAGKMEAFFREVMQTGAMPTQDPAVWLAHGMQVVGPPLAVAGGKAG